MYGHQTINQIIKEDWKIYQIMGEKCVKISDFEIIIIVMHKI